MAYPRYGTRNAPRKHPRRGWFALVVALLAVAALAALIVSMTGMIGGFVNGKPRGAEGSDPMFAEPPEVVTRPPSLTDEDAPAGDAGDPSQNWHYDTLTPLTPEGRAAS